jgi:hypothetical protein
MQKSARFAKCGGNDPGAGAAPLRQISPDYRHAVHRPIYFERAATKRDWQQQRFLNFLPQLPGN